MLESRLVGLIALMGVAGAVAHDSPAQLPEGEQSIESLLELPKELSPGRYVVQCLALVDASGYARRFARCHSEDPVTSRDLVESVATAIRRGKYRPAVKEGEAVEIFMLSMTIIDTRQQEPLILTVPNDGLESARFGLLYTAPQRLNYRELKYRRPARLDNRWRKAEVWQKLLVSERGDVIEHVVENRSGASAQFVSDVERSLPTLKFIPGFHAGRSVAMRYVEPLVRAR